MKNSICILLIAILPGTMLFSQEITNDTKNQTEKSLDIKKTKPESPPKTQPISKRKKREKPSTLINIDTVDFSGYGAPYMHFSSIDGKFGYLIGGRGGFIINEKFVIGAGGMGLTTPIDRTIENVNENVHFGYGGMFLEYYFMPKSLVHFSVGTLIGAGGYNYGHEKDNDSDHRKYRGKNFFVMEPEINIFVNVTPFLRIGVGAAYRYVYGLNGSDLKDSDISGKNGISASLIFGVDPILWTQF